MKTGIFDVHFDVLLASFMLAVSARDFRGKQNFINGILFFILLCLGLTWLGINQEKNPVPTFAFKDLGTVYSFWLPNFIAVIIFVVTAYCSSKG